jgi:hypothetical protein
MILELAEYVEGAARDATARIELPGSTASAT